MLATDPLGGQAFSPTLTVGAGTTVAGVSIALPTFQTPMPPPPIVRLLSAHARLTGGVLSLTARFSDPASGSVALWFTGRRRRRVLIYRVERRFVLRDGKVRLTITLPRRYRALASPTAHLALLDPADSARSFAIHVADSTGRSPRAHR